MTIEASSRKRFGRRGSSSAGGGLPIGELDANIFDCPVCTRPLSKGTSRCPSCRTRLIGGVRATRAAGFMAVGALAGLIVGGGGTGVFALMNGSSGVAAVEAPPVVTPSQVAVASAAVPAIDHTAPSSALSALRQSTVINQRLVADGSRLTQVLSVARPTAKDIAPLLRGLAATAAFGDGPATSVAEWDAGLAVSHALTTFYAAIGGAAQDGLAASVANDRAYVDAGRRMLTILDGLTDLDAASRVLAASADLELPPLIPVAP